MTKASHWMTTFRQLLIVEASALAALLVVAGVAAALGALQPGLASSSVVGPADSAQIFFVGTTLFGLLPALLFGAPGYVVLLRHGLARWPYVLLLGVFPGAVALFLEPTFGLFGIICGAAVALITHYFCRRLRLTPAPGHRKGLLTPNGIR